MNRVALFVGILLALAAPPAWAQRSGGRFGGSRGFRSSSSSSSSYRSSSSSYRSSSYTYTTSSSRGSYSTSTAMYRPPAPPPRTWAPDYRRPAPSLGALDTPYLRSRQVPPNEMNLSMQHRRSGTWLYGPARLADGVLGGLLSFLPLAGLSMLVTRQVGGSHPAVTGAAASHPFGAMHPGCEVRRVSVAFDWTLRARLQAELDRLASSVDVNSEAGLQLAAQRARDLLLGSLGAARYAAFQSFALTPEQAEARFAELVEALRGRYTVETVSNARRVVGPDVRARAEEGAGLVVVSMVVGTTRPLPALPARADRGAIAAALQSLVPAYAADLVALEVVWSPTQDSDRMSSAELEVLYPELLRLDGDAGLGRVACGYCRAVYAAEVGRCPGCGAPRG